MRIPPRSCFMLSGQKEGYADSQCDLKDCGNNECDNQNAGLFLKGHIEVQLMPASTDTYTGMLEIG